MTITTQVFEFLVGSKADIDALDAVSDDKFGKVCLVVSTPLKDPSNPF